MHSVGLFNIWTSQRSIAIDSKNQISFWSCNAKQYAMILLTFMVLFLVTLATEFTFLLSKRDGLNLRFFFGWISSHDDCQKWWPTFILVPFRSKIYTVSFWLLPSLEQFPPFFQDLVKISTSNFETFDSFLNWRCQKI